MIKCRLKNPPALSNDLLQQPHVVAQVPVLQLELRLQVMQFDPPVNVVRAVVASIQVRDADLHLDAQVLLKGETPHGELLSELGELLAELGELLAEL